MEEQVSAPEELQFDASEDPTPRSGWSERAAPIANGGARYKLMSPAKLPISRSACITIPPGLSPTSFLESPVLLSNVKAEPSPTTGSFMKPQTMHASASYSGNTISSNHFDDRQSTAFEFRPPPRSNMAPADHQLQSQYQNQSFTSSQFVKSERAVSSNELTLSAAPRQTVPSELCALIEVDTDGLNKAGNTDIVVSSQAEHNGSAPPALADDGYNWRKYGQKHVKGSEFPRSYYKCTHPNCEVKKLFERSHDGQITEIIYKGSHDHPKPQPSRRYSAGGLVSNPDETSDRYPSFTGQDDKASMYSHMSHTVEQHGNPELTPAIANDDSGEGAASNRTSDEYTDDDQFSKRRRMEGGLEITPVVKPIREPRVVVQTMSEVDILDDGYRWRKYGQKVVRGNPNPRSYYKCTNAGCPVRKHVERASHDPKAVITTYEGKHNHDVPTARTSNRETAALNGASRFKSEENGHHPISLDLGVGINSGAEHQHQQQMHAEQFVSHQGGGSSFRLIQANPLGSYYGVLNHGMTQYRTRENPTEGNSGEIQPLNPSSYQYPQNIGRIVTGP